MLQTHIKETFFFFLPSLFFEFFESHLAFNQAKFCLSLFGNSNPTCSMFVKRFGVFSHDSTNVLLSCSKVVLYFQTKLGLLQRPSQNEMVVQSLVSLHNISSDFSEPVYKSLQCNRLLQKSDSLLPIDNSAMHDNL